jgi:uncharacterized repeat protein (TIGR03803 family)
MRYFAFTLALGVVLCASRADSQTFTTLAQFTGTGGTAIGANPFGSLTVAGTTLYGMTSEGGANGYGNVFSIGIDGTNYQDPLSFTGTGGAAVGGNPLGGLALDGTTLYGMTSEDYAKGYGNIFSVGANGTGYQNLVSFSGSGGAAIGSLPYGNLTLAGTTIYGMTSGEVFLTTPTSGGFFLSTSGNVFSIGANGTNYQNLLSFTGSGSGGAANGLLPGIGNLTLVGTTLYGTTEDGGTHGDGNLFSVGVNGSNYQNLLSFTGTGGAASGVSPLSLTLAGTTFYGVTFLGGSDGDGNVFSVGVNGTNYQNLVSFTGSGSTGAANGLKAAGSLILSGTRLYGMTSDGGVYGEGNIFSLGIDGSGYRDLYDFTGGAGGGGGGGDLTLSGGTLFGVTFFGGDLSLGNGLGDGTVFALTLPTPTPEPGTLALVGAGAIALVSYRWRRMRPRRDNRR